MNRIDHVVEIAASSNHLPVVLSFLAGLVIFKRVANAHEYGTDVPGDNIPTTLIEGIGR